MGDRIIVRSTEPIDGAIALGVGVWEVASALAVVCDAEGKPVKDAKGSVAMADVYAIPAEAVALDKAADRMAAIKPRTDLDPRHPWYGYQFAASCFSGDTDRVMGSDGEWHPVRTQEDLDALIKAGIARREVEPPKEPDVKPVEEPIEGGEVVRVR